MSEGSAVSGVTLAAAMATSGPGEYADAVWIGALDEFALDSGPVRLQDAERYRRARLLVRRGRFPRGFVEGPVKDGLIKVGPLRAAIDNLPLPVVAPATPRPPISVVVCTYDRPLLLADALRSLQQLDYEDYEVIVVDNHPASGLVAPLLRELGDQRIRFVEQPERGLSRARNLGLLEAKHEIVAFTDDDVVVDRYWLQGIADGFAIRPSVACVTGSVPSGEIVSESQHYFDRRVGWAQGVGAEVFSMKRARPREPLFPFQVGRFGTGANFAVRREVASALGGFDEGFGVGSPTSGGEDIDMFVRVLLAGLDLAHEPAAIVWHRHRADPETLAAQLEDYGRSLGAWITKLLVNPRTLPMVLVRALPALRQLRTVTTPDAAASSPPTSSHLSRVEQRAVLGGPWAFARGRLAGSARPLRGVDRPSPTGLPGDATLPNWAAVGVACGLLASVGAIPSPARALFLLGFVALGPGSAVLAYWEGELATSVVRALVPVTGLALVTTAVSLGLFLNLWSPRLLLLCVVVATGAAAVVARRVLTSRARR